MSDSAEAAFLLVAFPLAGNRNDLPLDNLKDTIVVGLLIALQISVFTFAMTVVTSFLGFPVSGEVLATCMILGGALLL